MDPQEIGSNAENCALVRPKKPLGREPFVPPTVCFWGNAESESEVEMNKIITKHNTQHKITKLQGAPR